MKRLLAAGSTLVPSLLVLEQMGYAVRIEKGSPWPCRAVRGEEEYLADRPETLLGLIKLVEIRGSDWMANGEEIRAALRRYGLE
jgi:hypothetical protein